MERDEPVVGEGDAVGVAGQVGEDLLGAGERGLAVHHPARGGRALEPGVRVFIAWPGNLGAIDGGLEFGQELAAEDLGEDPNGQKEVRPDGDPVRVARVEPAGGATPPFYRPDAPAIADSTARPLTLRICPTIVRPVDADCCGGALTRREWMWRTLLSSTGLVLAGCVGGAGRSAMQPAGPSPTALQVLKDHVSVDVHSHAGPAGIIARTPPTDDLARSMRAGGLAPVCLADVPDGPVRGRNAAGAPAIIANIASAALRSPLNHRANLVSPRPIPARPNTWPKRS